MEFPQINIDKEIVRFNEHMFRETNNRIIFSGLFGTGKTYFIKKFFETNDNYEPVFINPINYSVSSNEDIFELIKYDIAFQILAKKPSFEKITFGRFFTTQFFLLENYKSIIGNLIQKLSKIDQSINTIVEPSVALGKKIEQYRLKMNIDEEKELFEFLNFFKDQKGTIREENSITELLTALIEILKSNSINKEVVLVIDDLDRIDPEHIFRILNVFSAHFDFQGLQGENKFGFDKIILICDIENIRGIFHNKYGSEIDFSGYIDKFYSHEIFYYHIENGLKDNLSYFISAIKTKDDLFDRIPSNHFIRMDLQFLLSFFIECKAINLRTLLTFLNQEIYLPEYKLIANKGGYNKISSYSPIIIVLEILEILFGSKFILLKAIDKVIQKYPVISIENYANYTNYAIGNLAMISNYEENQFFPSNYDNYTYDILGYRIKYHIELYENADEVTGRAFQISSIKYNSDGTTSAENNNYILPYFQLLKNAVLVKGEILKK